MNRREFLRALAVAAAVVSMRRMPTAKRSPRPTLKATGTTLEFYDKYRDDWCPLDGTMELVPLDIDTDWHSVSLSPEHVNCLCYYPIPAGIKWQEISGKA